MKFKSLSDSVFTDLARSAHRLEAGTVLSAWLYEARQASGFRDESNSRDSQRTALAGQVEQLTGGGVRTDPQSMTPEQRELHQKALKKQYEEWRLEDLQRANPSIAQPGRVPDRIVTGGDFRLFFA